MNDVEKIICNVSMPERLTQLAEECAELGHAALKLRRVIDGTNPTPVGVKKAQDALMEETADVLLCMAVTVPGVEDDLSVNWMIKKIVTEKAARWVDRLRARKRNEGNTAAAGTSFVGASADTFPKGEGKGDVTEENIDQLKKLLGVESPSQHMKRYGPEIDLMAMTEKIATEMDAIISEVLGKNDAKAE